MKAFFRLTCATAFAVGLGWACSSFPATATTTSSGPAPFPVNVPTTPPASAADCPNPPDLSSPLPPGATISPPSVVPAGVASITAAGLTHDLGGSCSYTLTLPVTTGAAASQTADASSDASSDASPLTISITYVGSDNDIYFPTGVADPITFTYGSHTCSTSAEIVSAYGLAVAEQELTSGYCTSDAEDPSVAWGFADAINTSEEVAPITQEPTFHTWYQSNEDGDIFFGQFQECMENPIGQQSIYVCAYNNYGPLF